MLELAPVTWWQSEDGSYYLLTPPKSQVQTGSHHGYHAVGGVYFNPTGHSHNYRYPTLAPKFTRISELLCIAQLTFSGIADQPTI
jgi:hypothetical protein